MKKFNSVILGIIDGVLPGVRESIKKTDSGQMDINFVRLFASLLAYGVFIALVRGAITLEMALSVIKVLFTQGE